MKKMMKAMSLLLALIMMLLPLAGMAYVYTESSKTYEAVVGEKKKITLASLEGDFDDVHMGIANEYHTEILDDLTVTHTSTKSGYTLQTTFTPIAEGTASFDAECSYTDDGEECMRVFHCTVTVTESEAEELEGPYKIKVSPVFEAGTKLSNSKVSISSGSHAKLGTPSYTVDGKSASTSFVPEGGETIRMKISLTAEDGYIFSDPDWIDVYVNSKSAEVDSGDSNEQTLIVYYDFEVEEGEPVVTKHPTGETVDEGGTCSFVARATGGAEITWYITDDDGYTVLASRAYKNFDGLKVTGCDGEKLKLSNIPASLDGYYAYAVFTNEQGEVESDLAYIRVNPDETPTPRPTKTPKPTPTPIPTRRPTNPPVTITTPTPYYWNSPAPTKVPYYATATPEVHVHQYSLSKTFDESYHYNTCSCGSKTNIEPHSFNTVQNRKTVTKTCTVCGYQVTEQVSSGGNMMVILLVGVIVVLFAIIIIGIVYLKKEGRI